jgi:hypothetical protein
VLVGITRVRVTASLGLIVRDHVVVDRAVPAIQDQLEECMGVGISRAGPHLHREHQEKNQTSNTEECG